MRLTIPMRSLPTITTPITPTLLIHLSFCDHRWLWRWPLPKVVRIFIHTEINYEQFLLQTWFTMASNIYNLKGGVINIFQGGGKWGKFWAVTEEMRGQDADKGASECRFQHVLLYLLKPSVWKPSLPALLEVFTGSSCSIGISCRFMHW